MNTSFEYAIHGQQTGDWITLSHSIGSSLEIWTGQMTALSHRYRVLAYNTRGHGQHRCASSSCTVDELASDVLQLWDQLGIVRSHFVGLSLGGCIGVAVAHQAPQRVASLVVACSRLEMDAAASDMWRQRAALVEQRGMTPVVTPTLERWLTPEFVAAKPAAVEQIRQTLLATSSQGFAACARALSDMHLEKCLAGLQVPTLFLAGQSDKAVSSAMIEHYAGLNPAFDFRALAGPHILNLENPDGFNLAVLNFIGRL